MVLALILAGAITLRGQSGPSSIGREVSVPVHLRDGQEYSMPIAALLAHEPAALQRGLDRDDRND